MPLKNYQSLLRCPLRRFIALCTVSLCAAPATSFSFTTDQTESWQKEILSQVQRQTEASNRQQSNQSKSLMSQDRMDQILGQVRDIATVKGQFQFHQVRRFCKPEISTFCSTTDGNPQALLQCLIKHNEQVSKQCANVISDNNRSQPSLADEWRHDILIPAGSTYYVDPVDKSLGVNLSRPSQYMNIPIVGQLTWYEGGSIRSYIPSNTPVQYGQLVFAPGQEISFFPNGQIKRGVLHQSAVVGSERFSAGQIITRDNDKQPFRSIR